MPSLCLSSGIFEQGMDPRAIELESGVVGETSSWHQTINIILCNSHSFDPKYFLGERYVMLICEASNAYGTAMYLLPVARS